ncbi:MAG: hypothetical protein P4L33_07375 [Capsulimonadaceae bacterium]|nr:hypothetical protein [Capsulimonadaceae bacterium]
MEPTPNEPDASPPAETDEPIEDAELLLKAEAKLAGRSARQWRKLLKSPLAEWLGPRWSTVLIACVILYWLWTTYLR